MVHRGVRILDLVRSFLVFVLAFLLVVSGAFVGGMAPADAVPNQGINDAENEETDIAEPTPPDAEDSGTGTTESEVAEPSGEPETPEDEPLPDGAVQGPFDAEMLRGQLNELNRALSPLATENTCNHATPGTGPYAETLCWIDFEGFTTAYHRVSLVPLRYESVLGSEFTAGGRVLNWGNVHNWPVEVNLGGGYLLEALLDVTNDNVLTTYGKETEAQSFPGYGHLGSSDFYGGLAGKPALYQRNGGETTVKLKNIQLTKDGIALNDYSMVVADAESTDNGERIDWSTTGQGFTWLPNNPLPTTRADVLGNACDSIAYPGWNTSTPTQEANCVSTTSVTRNGAPMLATAPPVSGNFEITQEMTAPTVLSGASQGVAFGVIVGRVDVQTEVEDRIVDASNQNSDVTNFSADFAKDSDNSNVVDTETGPSQLTSRLASAFLPASRTGTQLNVQSEAVGGEASSYTPEWRCEKYSPVTGQTTYWPSQFTSSPSPPPDADPFTAIKLGEILRCEVLYTPPYLSLEKDVDNASTEATHTPADFTVRAVGEEAGSSAISGPGNQNASVTKRPVAVGIYELSETSPDSGEDGNWEAGYDWSNLVCAPGTESTPLGDVTTETDDDANIVAASLSVEAGNDITCTFTNIARVPKVETSKEVFDADGAIIAWNSSVSEGDSLSYRLTFDNRGASGISIDYRDYLGDVLDDASFVDGSVQISDGQESSYPSSIADPGIAVTEQLNQPDAQLEITGIVPGGQIRTVWYQVEVLPNAESSEERENQAGNNPDDPNNRMGYVLRNYLLEAEETLNQACQEPATGEDSNCTVNPIPAWTMEKDSRPADGARLHKGGNTHYQITATKINDATTITDLVFEDDLTHVFNTAGWAPNAAVPGGALQRGIYFFNAEDQSLDADGNPIGSVAVPSAAFDASSGYVPDPELEGGRWLLRTLPVTLPENAVRAEMWFAVEAGNRPANIPPSWPENSEPLFGSRYVNYARAQVGDGLAPNQCGIASTVVPDTSAAATDADPVDSRIPESCWVIHQMSDNYFTIRKDARGAGIEFPDSVSGWGDGTGLTNMVGHEFEIRDDLGGQPSEYPSVKLCREEYHPSTWNGDFISGGTPDWEENSATLAAIIEHNNGLVTGEPELPLCGIFYPQGTFGGQEHAGGQDGRWRSEYLSDGDYWLVETKAPNQQINNSGTEQRQVPGVQLLTQPIAFRVWPEADGPFFGPQDPQQSMEGRGQLDIVGLEQQRCSPGAPVGERPIACVNPTGYLMLVQDVVPISMPFTGGRGTSWITYTGAGLLLSALIGVWLWRRHRELNSIGGANPM